MNRITLTTPSFSPVKNVLWCLIQTGISGQYDLCLINERTNERTNERMNERANEKPIERTKEQATERVEDVGN